MIQARSRNNADLLEPQVCPHQVIERIILKGHVMHPRGGFHALGEIGKVHECQTAVGGIVGIPAKRADLGIGVNTEKLRSRASG
jgi:hypothetical protein